MKKILNVEIVCKRDKRYRWLACACCCFVCAACSFSALCKRALTCSVAICGVERNQRPPFCSYTCLPPFILAEKQKKRTKGKKQRNETRVSSNSTTVQACTRLCCPVSSCLLTDLHLRNLKCLYFLLCFGDFLLLSHSLSILLHAQVRIATRRHIC